MRRELMTKDELMSHLRENGIENINEVKKAFVEGDGNISRINVWRARAGKKKEKAGKRTRGKLCPSPE